MSQHHLNGERPSIDKLDLELSFLREYEQAAKKKRNQLTDAYKLPNEVIGEIFQYVRSMWEPRRVDEVVECSSDKLVEVPRYTAGWMSVIHVCSKWRDVRLSRVHSRMS